MNPRIAKEIRVQMLPFGLLVATILISPQVLGAPGFWIYSGLCLFCLMIGSVAFGSEFQYRTLPMFLAQPVSRHVLWKEKMLVMSLFLLSASMVAVFGIILFDKEILAQKNAVFGCFLIPVCTAGGAAYWTMVFRSGLHGAIFGFVVPGALLFVDAWMAEAVFHTGEEYTVGRLAVVLLLYSTTTTLLGFKRFNRLEALDGVFTGAEVRLPDAAEALFTKPLQAVAEPMGKRWKAILLKEVRLQQFSYLFAGGFFALIGLMILRHGHLGWQKQSGDWPMVIDTAIWIYMVLAPVLAGALSTAEEKNWGVMGWHLMLPLSAVRQWLAKAMVTFATSIVIGVGLPLLFWEAGGLFSEGEGAIYLVIAFLVGNLLLTAFAMYASALVTAALRALLLCFGMVMGAVCFLRSGIAAGMMWRPEFRTFVALPDHSAVQSFNLAVYALVASIVLLLILQRFSFQGFRTQRVSVHQVLTQSVVLGVVLFLVGIGLGVFSVG